ncbi:hypothetical protein FH968_04450 [Buttiauxella sp. B2]|nr:hypothetical protein [Buttiauxella sp. B2]TNV22254.1 hypothetical protein FH968_04450 [Buttiauxella sp. B2]
MTCDYHYPLKADQNRVHSPAGVRALVEDSDLMRLLRALEHDGYDVSGAAAELAALINYVTSVNVSTSDVLSHLEYCAVQLRKNLPAKS